ncbi:MAG: YcaO-like family protein, partial [Pirellulaceae bacterium]
VDVASFGLDYWDRMQTHYRQQLHRDVHVLDITADLGIPSFAVISRRTDRPVEDILVGVAAHLDPRTALLRALVEANQSVPALSIQRPDGSTLYYTKDVPEAIDWWQTATYANQPYLLPDESLAPRTAADYRQLASGDVAEDVATCLQLAGSRQLEVLVVDQSRPDIELAVAKVVVPGLRHFWRRLAPGRLYDVPVALGWLPEPLREEELNPKPCFL